jgi:hypothetical protein
MIRSFPNLNEVVAVPRLDRKKGHNLLDVERRLAPRPMNAPSPLEFSHHPAEIGIEEL